MLAQTQAHSSRHIHEFADETLCVLVDVHIRHDAVCAHEQSFRWDDPSDPALPCGVHVMQVAEMIKYADANGDGEVDFGEFFKVRHIVMCPHACTCNATRTRTCKAN